MNVFLDYGCLVSMNQPRLVQDFTAKYFVKISLRRLFFVKAFILIFTDIWILTSPCPFLTPTATKSYLILYLWNSYEASLNGCSHQFLSNFLLNKSLIDIYHNIYIYFLSIYLFENRERKGDKSIYTRLYLPDLFEESDPMYTKPRDKQLCQV